MLNDNISIDRKGLPGWIVSIAIILAWPFMLIKLAISLNQEDE